MHSPSHRSSLSATQSSVCVRVRVCAAADVVATFLRSPSHNLRYVGVDALAGIIKINPQAAQVRGTWLVCVRVCVSVCVRVSCY